MRVMQLFRLDLKRIDKRNLALLLLGIAIMALKSNHALSHPQLWAEDGAVFLKQQMEQGGLLLLTPYADYLHAVPRLVAWIASFFSAAHTPTIYNTCAIVLAGMSIVICARHLAPLVPPLVFLGAMLLTPTNGEIFGTITNAQWFLQFALVSFCFIAPRNQSAGMRSAVLCFVAIVALTGPFSILCTMIMASLPGGAVISRLAGNEHWRAGFSQYLGSRDLIAWAIVAVAAVIQLGFVLTAASGHGEGVPLHRMLIGTLGQAVPLHIFGFNPVRPILWPFIFIGAGIYILFFAKASVSMRLGFAALYAFALLEVLAGANKVTFQEMLVNFSSDRYMLAIKVVFWCVIYVVLRDLLGSRREAISFVAMFLLFLAALNHDKLIRPAFNDYGRPEVFRKLDQPGTHTIPLNPQGWDQTIVVEE